MRTTVDLPADLMHAAKVRAAERGESLKDLFTEAIAREVGLPRQRTRRRVALPLVGSEHGPLIEVTNADIEAALETDDTDRYADQDR